MGPLGQGLRKNGKFVIAASGAGNLLWEQMGPVVLLLSILYFPLQIHPVLDLLYNIYTQRLQLTDDQYLRTWRTFNCRCMHVNCTVVIKKD